MPNLIENSVVHRHAGRPLADFPLLIFVGVTGVGKSTTLAALTETGHPFTLLPNRRVLTDDLIIAPLQIQDGEPSHPVSDRGNRFEYTRRYREQYPGGMAHALSQLQIDPDRAAGKSLCFDGLRGVDEVRYATHHLPLARFVVLDAPDLLRVERLLGRGDDFDRIETGSRLQTSQADRILLPGAEEIFSAEELRYLHSLVAEGAVDPADLKAKVAIVVAERRNYDPAAAIAELQRLAPTRTLIIDTASSQPHEIARRILTFWQ